MSPVWRRLGRFGLGAVVLALVLVSVNPATVAASLRGASASVVVVGVLGLVATHLIAAAGWRAILAASGVVLPWRSTVALYYAAQAIGGVTPANLGGDVHRVASLRGAGHGWGASAAPVIVQRATSYLALAALGLVAMVSLAGQADLGWPVVIAGLAFAIAVGASAILLLAPPGPMRPLHDRLVALAGGGSEAVGAVDGLGRGALIGLASGLAFHAVGIGFTWLLVMAVAPSLPVAPVVAALTVARLSLAVPFTPSGLGVQEGVLAGLLLALGLPAAGALAGMLLARLGLLVTTLVGVGLLVGPRPAVPAAHEVVAERS